MIELPALPFAKDAPRTLISAATFEYDYGKRHRAYVNNRNQIIPRGLRTCRLRILCVPSRRIFNGAAQIWRHPVFWNCLSPRAAGKPAGALLQRIAGTAIGRLGAGWVRLLQTPDRTLEMRAASNAGAPLTTRYKLLLTREVCEHADNIDWRTRGANWDWGAKNLTD